MIKTRNVIWVSILLGSLIGFGRSAQSANAQTDPPGDSPSSSEVDAAQSEGVASEPRMTKLAATPGQILFAIKMWLCLAPFQ